jgi:glutamate carboxypeptidase
MRRIVADHLPHTGAEITFDDGYPPLAPSEGNRLLLALYDEASRDLGFGPVTEVDPSKAGAADISFTETLVGMALDGIGLMGEGGHTVRETADLRTLPSQAKRAAVTLLRLATIPPPSTPRPAGPAPSASKPPSAWDPARARRAPAPDPRPLIP